MKKLMILLITALFAVSMVACTSTDNEDNNDPTDTTENNQPSDETDNSSSENNDDEVANGDATEENNDDTSSDDQDISSKMEQLEFAEFEIEIEYANHKEYEAEIEKKPNGYEATLDDDLTDTHLKGDGAFDHLYDLARNLNLTKGSSKDEVIDEVLKAFDLDSNYEEFEVEFTFHDGVQLEYEDK